MKLLQDAEYTRWFRTGFCVGIIALLHLFGQHAGEESLGLTLSYCSTDSPRAWSFQFNVYLSSFLSNFLLVVGAGGNE